MVSKVFDRIATVYKSSLFRNGSWGIVAQLSQTLFSSLFFIIIARNYSTAVFASFIIATVLYQLIAAFSSLGLSQWFIREITGVEDKADLVNKFFKLQIYSSAIFYLINIAAAFLLYNDSLIQILAILTGLNIVFDNLINAVKCINISELNQRKSFIILSTESFLKFAVTCFVFIYPFSIITLSVILILIRIITLNLFLSIGSSKLLNLKSLFGYKISLRYVKELLILNWPFIIIGSVSIVNWRIAAIIISKSLSPTDVARYEISYRIFSVATMLPIVVSASLFPIMVKYFKESNIDALRIFYKKMHLYYSLFGLLSFTFIYSFAEILLPIIFGANYLSASDSVKQMFLTILVFPTVYLQANLIVALNSEKMDMWFNIISLLTYLTFCLVGLYFFKSLMVVNISILSGFLCFHILQDILLVAKKISSVSQSVKFYFISAMIAVFYILLSGKINAQLLFIIFWVLVILVFIARHYFKSGNKKLTFPQVI